MKITYFSLNFIWKSCQLKKAKLSVSRSHRLRTWTKTDCYRDTVVCNLYCSMWKLTSMTLPSSQTMIISTSMMVTVTWRRCLTDWPAIRTQLRFTVSHQRNLSCSSSSSRTGSSTSVDLTQRTRSSRQVSDRLNWEPDCIVGHLGIDRNRNNTNTFCTCKMLLTCYCVVLCTTTLCTT